MQNLYNVVKFLVKLYIYSVSINMFPAVIQNFQMKVGLWDTYIVGPILKYLKKRV